MKTLILAASALSLMAGAALAANSYDTTVNGMEGTSTGYAGGEVSDGATAPITRSGGMEATDRPVANDNRQAVKPYTKNMSKDDYDASLRTKNKGQATIQPRQGVMGDDGSALDVNQHYSH